MFKRFSLRFKLTVAFILIASLVVAGTYYEWRAVNRAHGLLSSVVENDTARRDALEEMRIIAHETYYNTLLERYGAPANYTSRTRWEEVQARLAIEQERYRVHVAPNDNGAIARLDRLEKIKKATATFVHQAMALEGRSRSVSNTELQAKEEAFTHNWKELTTLFGVMLQLERQAIAEGEKKAAQEVHQAAITTSITAALPVLTAIILGLLVSSFIGRRLTELKTGVQRLANGDFSQLVPVRSHDETGELAAAFNQMSDRLRELYERLALEKQRDEALIESMGEAVIAVDAENKVSLINSAATKMLKLPTRAELLGRPFASKHPLYTPEGSELKKEEYPGRTALYESKAVNGVFLTYLEGKNKLLVNIIATPVIVDGKTVGAIILARDVTKEKEVDRMKTEFISLASHQLRTPLSAIKWYAEMLLSGDAGALKSDQKDFAQNIYDSSSRMNELVSSLLNISRIESGRIMVDPKPTDLKELVSGIVTDLKAKTEERQQTLIISVHKDLPKIKLDPRLIGQVYMNLLTNAIKYTPKGGEISVFISKKGDQVLSQVTDNGYGIPKSQHDRVFQKFFRAENVTKIETDGTGLGLYLIKAVIESSGGKIWFESEEGKGTTFWFTLPLAGMKPKKGEVTLDG